MIFTFGKFTINVDIEKNREFYHTAETPTEGCVCDGCRNFEKAVDSFPKSVKEFFENLGIVPEKPAEVYVNCSEENGKKLFYGGFYHLCGTVLDGDNAWKTQIIDSTTSISHIDQDYLYEIDAGFYVTFCTGGTTMLEDGFPEPVITMDIEFHIPWVLDTENTYL